MQVNVLRGTGVQCSVCGMATQDVRESRALVPLVISVETEGGVLAYLCPRHCLELVRFLEAKPWASEEPEEEPQPQQFIAPLARQFRVQWEAETIVNGKPNGEAVERTLRAFGMELARRLVT